LRPDSTLSISQLLNGTPVSNAVSERAGKPAIIRQSEVATSNMEMQHDQNSHDASAHPFLANLQRWDVATF